VERVRREREKLVWGLVERSEKRPVYRVSLSFSLVWSWFFCFFRCLVFNHNRLCFLLPSSLDSFRLPCSRAVPLSPSLSSRLVSTNNIDYPSSLVFHHSEPELESTLCFFSSLFLNVSLRYRRLNLSVKKWIFVFVLLFLFSDIDVR